MPKGSGPIGRPKGSVNAQQHNAGGKRVGSGRKKAVLPTQSNSLASYFVSTKRPDNVPTPNPTFPNETEADAQRTTTTNNSISEEEVSAALKQKREVYKKLKEIHRTSEFQHLDVFESDEEDDDTDDESLCSDYDQSTASSSKKRSSKKEEFAHSPPKGSLLHNHLSSMKSLVLSSESECLQRGKNWIVPNTNPLGGSHVSSDVSSWLLSEVWGYVFSIISAFI